MNIKLFDIIQRHDKAVNWHYHSTWDWLFGLINTRPWQETWKTCRDHALDSLKTEVNQCTKPEEQIALLRAAKKHELFSKHRNNFWFTGAWGKTNAVKEIEMIEQEIMQKSA